MAALADFLPLVRGSAPGCPNRLLLDAIRDAAIEFQKRAQITMTDSATVTTQDGKVDYPVSISGGVVAAIQSVRQTGQGIDLDPLSWEDFYEKVPTDGEPWAYTFHDQNLYFWPKPNGAYTFDVVAIVRTADDSDEVPDELYTNWRRAIAFGAKAIIHSEYDSYIDAGKYRFNRDMFDSEVFKANVKRARGGTNRPLRVRARFQ